MKIIDLLNRIAKDEEVPKKIRFDGTYWNRICGEKYTYYIDDDNDNDLFIYFFRKNLTFNLNDEVEIIEEDKKIDILPMLEDDGIFITSCAINQTRRKINEIIDYINKGDK